MEFKRPRNEGRVSLDRESPNGDPNVQGPLCSGSSIDTCNSQQVSHCNSNSVSSSCTVGSVKSKPRVQHANHQTEQAADVVETDAIKHNHKTAFENLLCIEIFLGSGRLTAAIRKIGMRAVAIDRSADRTSGPVMTLDLTKADDVEFLKNFIISERMNIVYIHIAPPCGTCSAARNKRHRDLEAAGYDLPRPLRSKLYPMGLPTLRGLDAAKVASANLLYFATLEIAKICLQYDILLSIENPENSLFWDTDPMIELFALCPGYHNVFQSCMMGGERDKRTKWWSSKANFEAFNILCNGAHQHKPWKPVQTESGLHFPTSEEAAYPLLLCERVAHVIKEAAEALGIKQTESLLEQSQQQTSAALQHVNMGFLARGHRLKPLVSEFSHYLTWLFAVGQSENLVQQILNTFPKGARIVHRKLLKWGEVRVSDVDGHSLGNTNQYKDKGSVEKLSFGIPREPDDFVKEAIKAGHPRFLDFKSIDNIDNLLKQNMVGEASTILANRAAWLKRWTLRAAQLSGAEHELHQSLAPHCSAVLKGKRLLLFGEMLRDISYPDTHLVEDICAGFRVTGWLRDSGCFEKLPKQPSVTVTGLLGMARGLNRSVLARASASEDKEMVRAAWDETQLKVERNWIWRDDSQKSDDLSLTHRFVLQQKKKVRVIDNFKTSGVNSTCGMVEKPKLFGLDFLATTIVRLLSTFGPGAGAELMGKTFDLSSAYKQYPIHSFDRSFIRIAVPKPGEDSCAIYGLNALPFGASGSVSGFLRVSTAVFHILTMGLHVWAGTFFDDFPIISRADIASQTEQHVAMLLDLLGLRFAREGKKWKPFDQQMEVLGVVIDFSKFCDGVVFFRHTDSRKEELEHTISRHLETNKMTCKEAETLRGRLIWFESFMFGRIANLSLHEIGKRATSDKGSTTLNDSLVRALTFFKRRVLQGPPIEIRAAAGEVVHIFTDGAFEPDAENPGTLGGIIYSETGERLGFFSEIVPEQLLNEYLKFSLNPIYLIELLASLVALSLWGSIYPHRYVVNYIDNEASRSALIKAWSGIKHADAILAVYVDLELKAVWKPWFSRVASFSNPSDDPSRLKYDHLIAAGVKRFFCDWKILLPKLMAEDTHV